MRYALLLTLMACGSGTEAAQKAVDNAVEEAGGTTTTAAVLQSADAADGAEDKVVSKCSSCMLGMEGDAAHAVKHDSYELHFCSDSCKQRFESDPNAVLEKLN